jgi:hypothetical protein
MKISIIIIFSTLLIQLSSSLSTKYFNGLSEEKKGIILKIDISKFHPLDI